MGSARGLGMRAFIAASALVALVCIAGAASEYVDLDEGDMVQPISELEELETSRGGAKKAMQQLRKSVKGATSMKQVKKVMQKTIKGAVLKKKASLLQKASDKMKSDAANAASKQKAKEQSAKARLAKAKAKRKAAQEKSAKQEVIRLSNKIKGLKKVVGKKIKTKAMKRVKKVTKALKGKKYDLKHPNYKHMTRKQIKYWANRRSSKIFRSEDPLKKTKVMAKIFSVKNQEAKTLEKMNELNVRVGMKSKGIRASMLRKGRTAIVNGELIKPKAKYNVKRSFQGSKQRNDPKLMPPTRDPRKDKLKKLSGKHLVAKMKANSKKMDKAIKAAKSAAKDNGKPVNKKRVNKLKSLKKAVKKNKKLLAKKPTELGDSDQDDDFAAQDEADADAAIERGDDEALQDDTAVDMAMDANDVDTDIDSITRDEEDEDDE